MRRREQGGGFDFWTNPIEEGCTVPFNVASSSQAKQGGNTRLTQSLSDYNWAT
jgi:hypothetical protein